MLLNRETFSFMFSYGEKCVVLECFCGMVGWSLGGHPWMLVFSLMFSFNAKHDDKPKDAS